MATFNGSEGAMIDPTTAQRWVGNYQNTEPFGVKAEFLGRQKIEELLKQSGAVGLRIYYAKDDYEGWRLVLVAVNADGKNLGPIAGGGAGKLLQDGVPCPPYCP